MTTSSRESSWRRPLRVGSADATALWQDATGSTQALGRRWISSGLLLTAVFWLILNMLARFSSPVLARSSVALGTVVAYSTFLYLAERRITLGEKGRGHGRRIVTLARVEHSCALLFVVSAFSLAMGLALSTSIEIGLPILGLALTSLYLVNAGAAAVWAPRSMLITSAKRAQASERQSRWLPYAIGCQGLIVGGAVFLSAMMLQGMIPWGQLLVLGLGTLCALITLTLAIASFYRILVLSANVL